MYMLLLLILVFVFLKSMLYTFFDLPNYKELLLIAFLFLIFNLNINVFPKSYENLIPKNYTNIIIIILIVFAVIISNYYWPLKNKKLYKENEKIYKETEQIYKQQLEEIKEQIYKENDMVNLINKKDYKNIEYKYLNLGDKCTSSQNCDNGLSCVFDGCSSYCAKEIPLLKCEGYMCDQKTNSIGKSCGKSFGNNVLQDICNQDLKCMSGDFRDDQFGTCSKILA